MTVSVPFGLQLTPGSDGYGPPCYSSSILHDTGMQSRGRGRGKEHLSALLHPCPMSLYSEKMKLHRAMSEFTHFMLCLAIMRKKALQCNLVLSALHLGALGSKKVIIIFLLKVIVGLLFSLKGEKNRIASSSPHLCGNLDWRTVHWECEAQDLLSLVFETIQNRNLP